jgi:hypothetical protein
MVQNAKQGVQMQATNSRFKILFSPMRMRFSFHTQIEEDMWQVNAQFGVSHSTFTLQIEFQHLRICFLSFSY